MALCHKWDVKNDLAYMLQFFSLISDGLGSVVHNAFFINLPMRHLGSYSFFENFLCKVKSSQTVFGPKLWGFDEHNNIQVLC